MTERDAIDDVLRETLPRLRRFARWLCRDLARADDLVQVTLERALSRWPERRDPESLRPWVFGVLYRQYLDGRRRARWYAWFLARLRRGGAPEPPPVERDVPAQPVVQAFAQLSAEQRSILFWVAVEGLTYREISEILEVPIGTVMSRLSRARQALRRLSDGDTPVPALRVIK